MSYILSALKKAEQERHSGGVPDVLTPQAVGAVETVEEEPRSPRRATSKLYLAGGVAAVLLASLWAVGMLRFGGAGSGSFEPPPSVSGVTSEPSRRTIPAPPSGFQPGTLRGQASLSPSPPEAFSGSLSGSLSGDRPVFDDPPPGAPGADAGAAEAAAKRAWEWPAGDAIPDVAELPVSLRKSMPPLELTGHLYSLGHPNARKVILNGAALKEGQYLDDDLMVSEITPDGVILDFHGRLFRIGADQMFR